VFVNAEEKQSSMVIGKMLAASMFDNSLEAVEKRLGKFNQNDSWNLYGWEENGEMVGICGFEVHSNKVTILNIAVAETARGQGVGRKMVVALRQKFQMPIYAETDDDAVGFYRKCGFEVTETQRHGVRRWSCVLI